jgi:protein-tyrosine kinase
MSAILKALERAEQERGTIAYPNGQNGNGNGAHHALNGSNGFGHTAEPVSTSDWAAPSSSVGLATRGPAPALDLPGIRTCVWTPDLVHLPALQERGLNVEQFRSLRSRMFGFRELNTLKSILISSGMPQEGKTFTAANLAISFARHKASRVLLIDGDMRRNSLHNLLGCPSEPGLTGYLAGKASLFDILQRPQPDPGGKPLPPGLASLTFIPGGNEGDKAADLSGSARFKELLTTLAPHFDWIIVDSSPVNLVSDGVNLAQACDGVLLIVRSGVTRMEGVQKALGELKASAMLGVVLNGAEKTDIPGYYYGYGYDSADDQRTTIEGATA